MSENKLDLLKSSGQYAKFMNLIAAGNSMSSVCRLFGISSSTIRSWKEKGRAYALSLEDGKPKPSEKKYHQFVQDLERDLAQPEIDLVSAVFKSALGRTRSKASYKFVLKKSVIEESKKMGLVAPSPTNPAAYQEYIHALAEHTEIEVTFSTWDEGPDESARYLLRTRYGYSEEGLDEDEFSEPVKPNVY